jgi:uncharacterized protein YggE
MKRFGLMLLMLVLLASAFPAWAGGENVSKVIVQGQGQTSAPPDRAVVVLGVETRDAKASTAAAENADLMNKVVQALLSAGLEMGKIQTSHYSLYREQATVEGRKDAVKPPEFVATNQVTAEMNATDDPGKVIDAALGAGANKVVSLSFDLRDPKAQMDAALADAVADARRKAEVVALAAGVKLGRVLEVSEGYSFRPTGTERFFVGAAPTPVLTGEVEVTSSVTMTYEIKG